MRESTRRESTRRSIVLGAIGLLVVGCLAGESEEIEGAPELPVCRQQPLKFACLLQRLTIEDSLASPEDGRVVQYTSTNHFDLQRYWDILSEDGAWNDATRYGYASGGTFAPYRRVTGFDGRTEYEFMPRTQGPGYVARIWLTHKQHGRDGCPENEADWGCLRETGNIRIYFDDEPSPRVDMPVEQFFGGLRSPWLAPLVSYYAKGDGGNVSYVPLPFANSIRATLAPPGGTDRYVGPRLFQVTIKQFPAGVPVSSFRPDALDQTDQQMLDWAVGAWLLKGQNPNPPIGGTKKEYALSAVNVPAGQVLDLRIPSPGTIRELRVIVPSGREHDFDLEVYWDGSQQPALVGPLRALFGATDATYAYESMVMGIRSTGLMGRGGLEFYSRFPMPFSSALLRLRNRGSDAVASLSASVQDGPPPSARRLFAKLQTQQHEPGTPPVAALDVNGAGRFVGLILSASSFDRSGVRVDANTPLSADWRMPYLEGNLDVSVDGATILGTGLEDDFNAGYYFLFFNQWNPGASRYPLSGCLWKDWDRETAAMYRFYLTDSIEFRRALRVNLGAGIYEENIRVTYATTAFYYQ